VFVSEFHNEEEEPIYPHGPLRLPIDDNIKVSACLCDVGVIFHRAVAPVWVIFLFVLWARGSKDVCKHVLSDSH